MRAPPDSDLHDQVRERLRAKAAAIMMRDENELQIGDVVRLPA
jgi:hypothetical protein